MNRRKFIRNFLIGAAGIAAASGGGIFYYINTPKFGRLQFLTDILLAEIFTVGAFDR